MSEPVLLVLCSCPDTETAHELADSLIDARLAACVNISAPSRSLYRWQGETETAEEILLNIKTLAKHYPRVEQHLRQRHPYQTPEIIALPVTEGLPDYLKWVEAQCDR